MMAQFQAGLVIYWSWNNLLGIAQQWLLKRMARAYTAQRRILTTVAAWIIGFLIFFPILWMVLTSFKTELEAFSTPPKFLFFDWTLENFGVVQERSNYLKFAGNSIILSVGSTLVGLLFAVPAAWAMRTPPPTGRGWPLCRPPSSLMTLPSFRA